MAVSRFRPSWSSEHLWGICNETLISPPPVQKLLQCAKKSHVELLEGVYFFWYLLCARQLHLSLEEGSLTFVLQRQMHRETRVACPTSHSLWKGPIPQHEWGHRSPLKSCLCSAELLTHWTSWPAGLQIDACSDLHLGPNLHLLAPNRFIISVSSCDSRPLSLILCLWFFLVSSEAAQSPWTQQLYLALAPRVRAQRTHIPKI